MFYTLAAKTVNTGNLWISKPVYTSATRTRIVYKASDLILWTDCTEITLRRTMAQPAKHQHLQLPGSPNALYNDRLEVAQWQAMFKSVVMALTD